MALIAVNEKEAMNSNCSGLCMPIKVLQPCNLISICSLANLADLNNLVAGYEVIVILCADMILSRKDDVQRNCCLKRINALDHYYSRSTA